MDSSSSDPTARRREAILAQLASIHAMERGTLTEEYRERPAPDGEGVVRKGPYFKHQCWENRRNRSRRVPADEVPVLRDHLANGERFDRLVGELAQLAVEHGRQVRAQPSEQSEDSGKKNSSSKASGSATARPKRSSRASRSGSPPRASKA